MSDSAKASNAAIRSIAKIALKAPGHSITDLTEMVRVTRVVLNAEKRQARRAAKRAQLKPAEAEAGSGGPAAESKQSLEERLADVISSLRR